MCVRHNTSSLLVRLTAGWKIESVHCNQACNLRKVQQTGKSELALQEHMACVLDGECTVIVSRLPNVMLDRALVVLLAARHALPVFRGMSDSETTEKQVGYNYRNRLDSTIAARSAVLLVPNGVVPKPILEINGLNDVHIY